MISNWLFDIARVLVIAFIDSNLYHIPDVLELWKSADAVCFDVDSTVCTDEGIDELAEFCGAGKAVAEWTARLVVLIHFEYFQFIWCCRA